MSVRRRSTIIRLGGETTVEPTIPSGQQLIIARRAIAAAFIPRGQILVTGGGAGDGFPVYGDRQATINPGDDWDTVINSNPTGTLFGVSQGVHVFDSAAAQFSLRQGDRFVGQTGADGLTPLSILRGNWPGTQGGTGLKSPWGQLDGEVPPNVQLLRLDFQFFAPEFQQTAIGGNASGWRVHKCWIHDIKSGGFRIGPNSIMSGGKIFRCGQIGLKQSTGCNNGVIDGVEIYDNNYADWNAPGNEAGGMKFAGGLPTNMVIRNCHFHDNHGPGIWYDAAGAGGIIEDNISEDNLGAGLFYELSLEGAQIRRNIVRRNTGAGEIYVANSRGTPSAPIVVNDNIVSYHNNPNVATLAAKDDANRSPRLGYVTFRNNQVTDEDTLSGVFGSNGADGTTAPGIVFDSNDYFSDAFGSGSGAGWRWGDAFISWAAWQALGFDLTGTRQAAP